MITVLKHLAIVTGNVFQVPTFQQQRIREFPSSEIRRCCDGYRVGDVAKEFVASISQVVQVHEDDTLFRNVANDLQPSGITSKKTRIHAISCFQKIQTHGRI